MLIRDFRIGWPARSVPVQRERDRAHSRLISHHQPLPPGRKVAEVRSITFRQASSSQGAVLQAGSCCSECRRVVTLYIGTRSRD